MQDYLQPNDTISSIKDGKTLFNLESGMVEVKSNFSSKYSNKYCEMECGELENIQHILECVILNEKSEESLIFKDIHSNNIYEQIKIL